jgi:asparagine synthase (glutamine-hydrolysing)
VSSLAGFVGFTGFQIRVQSVSASVSAQTKSQAAISPIALDDAVFGADCPGSTAADNRLLVAADARIDNRSDLCELLNLPGTASAADIVLAGWHAWGEDLPNRLLGDFAVALFCRRERALWLFRDPSSERPLSYTQTSTGICFSSAVIGLRPLAGGLDVAFDAIAGTMSGVSLDTRTNFRNVYRVLSAEIVCIRHDGRNHRRRYWQPEIWPDVKSRAGDRTEEYRHLLRLAVSCRVEAGAVATQLSSGWDSSAVTAMAAQVAGRQRTIAFTSAPLSPVEGSVIRGRLVDESEIAALTAHRLGIEHVIVRETPKPFQVARDLALRSHYLVNCPFNMAWWQEIRAGARRANARSLLTGEMGNFTLNAGGIRTLRTHLVDRRYFRWFKEARACVAGGDVRWRGVAFASFEPILPITITRMLRNRYGVRDTAADFLRPEWRQPEDSQAAPASTYLERYESFLESDPGELRRSAQQEFGIVECDPTSDRRIMEFSLSLRPEDLISGGVTRPLARSALSGMIPMEVLNLRLRGLQGGDWYQRVSKTDALEALEDVKSTAAVTDFLDVPAMEEAISDWPSGDWNSEKNYGRYRISLARAICAGIFVKEVTGIS